MSDTIQEVHMTGTTLLKSIGISLRVCGMVLTHPFVLSGQETSQGQAGQACTIDVQRTTEMDKRQGTTAEMKEHRQKILSRMEQPKQSEEKAPAGPVAAEESHTLPPQPPGAGSEMGQYYLGRHYKNAVFPGRLVCLRCDTMPTPENVEVCRKEGHRHALAMEGDTMVHPLIFTSEDLFAKVNAHDWYRKKVRVWGRYYADTGFIVVGNIQPVEE
jgi:hypothetical protein